MVTHCDFWQVNRWQNLHAILYCTKALLLCLSADTPVLRWSPFLPTLRVCMAAWSWREETHSFRVSLTDWTENCHRKLLQWVARQLLCPATSFRVVFGKVTVWPLNVSSSWLMCLCDWQSMRLKLIANNTTVERRFSAWIGGSILASLVRPQTHTQDYMTESYL